MENLANSERNTLEEKELSLNDYRCVHCGHPIHELYKSYGPIVQKLSECENCRELADPYTEIEFIVIVIDLILLSKEAQRHVLYNTKCRNLYKILMIITLLESYCLWIERFPTKQVYENNDVLFLERGFYLSTLHVITSNICFICVIFILTRINGGRNFMNKLFKGFMLASIAKGFLLPIMIWRENISDINSSFHLMLVIGYFMISLIYIHSSIIETRCCRLRSTATVCASFLINKYILSQLKLKFEN